MVESGLMFYEELTARLYRWLSLRKEITLRNVEDTSPNQIKVPIFQSLKVLPRTLSHLFPSVKFPSTQLQLARG